MTDSVVFAEETVDRVRGPVSTRGEVRGGEVVVEDVLGKPGGMGVVVVGGTLSTVTGFVLVSVYTVVVVVLGTVVLSVTVEVSETSDGPGLETVTIGVTMAEGVVAFVVSSVGCTTAWGEVMMVVDPSVELVVGAVVVDGCRVVPVVVKSGFGDSVGLVDEMSQNRAVTAKGALLVLDVLGLKGLTVQSIALVTSVGWPSVTFTVDSGSTTSGLTAGGAVGGSAGAAVVESSGAAEEEVVAGWVVSSGAGGALDEVVCVLTAGTMVVI